MGKILDMEKALINKLNETNYELFEGDRNEALDFISDRIGAFVKYANVVIQQQIMQPVWAKRYEGQEYRDKVKEHDTKRKIAHDYAISSIDVLNRISKGMGIGKFADVDTSDRHAVAAFIGNFMNEIYNKGIGGSDDAFEKTEQYDENKMKVELQKIDDAYSRIKTNGDAGLSMGM